MLRSAGSRPKSTAPNALPTIMTGRMRLWKDGCVPAAMKAPPRPNESALPCQLAGRSRHREGSAPHGLYKLRGLRAMDGISQAFEKTFWSPQGDYADSDQDSALRVHGVFRKPRRRCHGQMLGEPG